jgi:hypothetical protein
MRRGRGLLAVVPVAVTACGGDSDPPAAKRGASTASAAPASGVARGDRYVPLDDMRAVARQVGSATRRLIVPPAAAGNDWDLLSGTTSTWSPLAARHS